MATDETKFETEEEQSPVDDLPSDEETFEAAEDPSEPLLDENDIPDALSAEDFDLDISDEVKAQEKLQEDVRTEMKPTTLERDIQQGIQDVREQIDEIEMDQKEELLNLEKSGIGTIAGLDIAEESISERDALKIEALQREKSNLLDRLGLEEEARQTRLNTAEEELRQNREDINTALKIRDRIQEREKAQRKREENLSSTQKQNLEDFVDFLSGTDPDTYDPQTQAKIAELAGNSGIPFNTVMNRLQLDYDKRIADQVDKAGEMDESLAGGFFSNAQIQKGASNANMSISEFQQLPRDEANQFVRGDKMVARPEDTTLTAEDFIADTFDKSLFRTRGGELRKAKERAIEDVRSQANDQGEVIVGDITYDLNDLISEIESIPETREEANRMLEIKQQLE